MDRYRSGRLALSAALLFEAGALTASADQMPALSQYVHQVWSLEAGLPSSTVTSLVRSADGRLWIGTPKGLVRFDGTEFTVFSRKTAPRLPANVVDALLQHSDGSIWVGTRTAGVARFDGSSFRTFDLDQGGASVHTLAEDRGGNVYAGTTRGLYVVGRDGSVQAVPGLESSPIPAIAVDAEGILRISTGERGLYRLSGGKAVPEHVEGIRPSGVNTLYLSSRGVLWGGTNDGRLLRLDRSGWRFVSLNGKIEGRVFALAEDSNGTLWVGTVFGGLYRIIGNNVTVLDQRTLRTSVVLALLTDADGSLWVGSDGGGLHQLRIGSFVPFGEAEGIGPVKAVYEDAGGRIWFGTRGDVIRKGIEGITRYSKADGLPGAPVWSITEHEGSIVAGTYGGGVWRLVAKRFVPLLPKDGTSRDFTRVVTSGHSGSLWIATNRGLFRWRRGEIDRPLRPEQLPGHRISFLHEARDGAVWIGCMTGGAARWDGRTVQRFPANGDSTESILEDSSGVIWLGMLEGGLLRLRDGKLVAIGESAGVPSTVTGIVEDRQGFLWLASPSGVHRVSRERLAAFDPTRGGGLPIRRFDAMDGLRSAECTSYGDPSIIATRSGSLWVSTAGGPAVTDTNRVSGAARPLPLFQAMAVNGKAQRVVPGMLIGPRVSRLDLRFSALRLTGGARIRYAYRLAGFEDTWHSAGTHRLASYMRIPPGTYELVVRAFDGGGASPSGEARLPFTVRPAFHETQWFLVCAALLTIALAIAAHRLLVFRIQKRAGLLEQLVSERTAQLEEASRREIERLNEMDRMKDDFISTVSHDLRTPLTSIRGALGLLTGGLWAANPEKGKRMIDIALGNTERLIRMINDILDIERMKSGRITIAKSACQADKLIEQSLDMVRALVQREQITVETRSTSDTFNADPDRLVQTLTNLLGNAIKFSPPQSTIRVTAERRAEDIVFAVADQGRGIPAEKLEAIFERFHQVSATDATVKGGSGLGLAICRSIVHLHGGRIWAESEPDRGSRFSFSIPAPG